MIVHKVAFLGTRNASLLVPSLRQLLLTILDLDLLLLDLALGLVVDLGEVLTNGIVGAQIGVGKVPRHLIARYSFMVHVHELLLNCQVMVSNGQNRNAIFEFLRGLRALIDLFLIILFLASRLPAMWQVVHKQRRLHDYDCLVRVKHGMIVPAELGQDSAHVQMSVSLCSGRLMPLFDLEGLLQEDQSRTQLIYFAIVAG